MCPLTFFHARDHTTGTSGITESYRLRVRTSLDAHGHISEEIMISIWLKRWDSRAKENVLGKSRHNAGVLIESAIPAGKACTEIEMS